MKINIFYIFLFINLITTNTNDKRKLLYKKIGGMTKTFSRDLILKKGVQQIALQISKKYKQQKPEISQIFKIFDKKQKPHRKLQVLLSKIKKLNQQVSRKAFIEKLIDAIQVPDYEMMAHVSPTFTPQVQDPRIRIQTFNPPPQPLLPGMLQNPHFKYNLTLPQQIDPPTITKEINIVTKEQLNTEVSKVIKKSFFKAMEKLGMGKYTDKKQNTYRVNIFNSNTERILDGQLFDQKYDKIKTKLNSLIKQYQIYGQSIQKRLEKLDFLLQRKIDHKMTLIIQ